MPWFSKLYNLKGLMENWERSGQYSYSKPSFPISAIATEFGMSESEIVNRQLTSKS